MAANQQKITLQPTKNSGRDGGDYGGEARRAGGAGEAQYHRFGLSFDNKKIKKINEVIKLIFVSADLHN
jgi:hypothetical protein